VRHLRPTAVPYAAAVYTLTETVGIDRPSVDVWAILIDFPNVPAWEKDVLEVRQTSPGCPARGTTFVARRLFGGRESLIDCRITAWEDGCAVTMELQGGVVRRASVTYAVEPTGADSCRVSYSIEGQMRPLLAWTTPFIPAIGRRLVRGNLANLARLAERAAVA
jgi:Polyketide cyclase / dehydrase and lipid transport